MTRDWSAAKDQPSLTGLEGWTTLPRG
jgi:hypothetical protein